jgi:hypothetical protein
MSVLFVDRVLSLEWGILVAGEGGRQAYAPGFGLACHPIEKF